MNIIQKTEKKNILLAVVKTTEYVDVHRQPFQGSIL